MTSLIIHHLILTAHLILPMVVLLVVVVRLLFLPLFSVIRFWGGLGKFWWDFLFFYFVHFIVSLLIIVQF